MRVMARSLVVILVALIAVPALAVSVTMTTAVQLLAATTVLMMGGTGTPLDPSTPAENKSYMETMLNGYFLQYADRQAVHTPEEFYPTVGDLTLDESVAEGVQDLHPELIDALATGNHVIVFGYSQSATIIAFEKQNLANEPTPPDPNQLEFIVVGSISNPDGGILTRLPGLQIPGVTFGTAMPNDEYLTTSYVREYDGLADLPDNPLNLLALGNALVGALVVHPDYTTVNPTDPNNIQLPSTDPDSVYILMPTPRLPILMIFDGVVPEPILAGLDPVIRWGVDLGYDRTTPANEPTPFTLLPSVNQIAALGDLPGAIVDGIDAAAAASNLPPALPLQSNSNSALARAGSNDEPEVNEKALPDAVTSQPEADGTNTAVGEKHSAATGPRPFHLVRDSLKFGPDNRPSAIRSSGDGPLKRIVDALTGQRPKPAAETQTADDQKPAQQDEAA
jgi:PE-PPE domain